MALSLKLPPTREQKKFLPQGSPQLIEKAQERQGNSRKSEPFSLIYFARTWVDFGKIWIRLRKRWPPRQDTALQPKDAEH
jgi:hypothetical protein